MTRSRALALSILLVVGCGDTTVVDSGVTPVDDGGAFDGGSAFPDAGRHCTSDRDCDDALSCNGIERCVDGLCQAGTPRQCDDGIACTTDFCSEELQSCVNRAVDADGDGVAAASCVDDRGVALGTDCDDTSAARFPGATEVCDAAGVDEDCNDQTFGTTDFDGDGYVSARCCNGTRCGDDCNDAVRGAHPTATEVCNGIDDDCDGNVDEELAVAGFRDNDGDGRGDPLMPIMACPGAARFSRFSDDCDDTRVDRSGVLPEVCDGVDNNCDGEIDNSTVSARWYPDRDGDLFGTASEFVISCAPPEGAYSLVGTDCNDGSAAINPSATELCNGLDDDCDGAADFVIAPGDLEDDDRDGIPDAACNVGVGDCDDRDPSSAPGSIEACDGRDNDCDGTTDEDVASFSFFRDADGDGFGTSNDGVLVACTPQSGYVRRGGDCDDASAVRYPGAVEGCNGRDDDCDSAIDEAPATATSCTGDAVCSAGRCRAPLCTPSEATCASATTRRVCDSDGLGARTETCGSGLVCSNGTCGTCNTRTNADCCGVACALGNTCVPNGASASCVPSSCAAAQATAIRLGAVPTDGTYTIDVDGTGPRPAFAVYCGGMTTFDPRTYIDVSPIANRSRSRHLNCGDCVFYERTWQRIRLVIGSGPTPTIAVDPSDVTFTTLNGYALVYDPDAGVSDIAVNSACIHPTGCGRADTAVVANTWGGVSSCAWEPPYANALASLGDTPFRFPNNSQTSVHTQLIGASYIPMVTFATLEEGNIVLSTEFSAACGSWGFRQDADPENVAPTVPLIWASDYMPEIQE